ncbi:MAG: hypothetical protein PUE01_04335 [Clostridiaceae bacterium]|nr:hypothetical protein [Clostridiaceae bacterium]
MDPSKDKATLERAKKMLIAGDSYDSIMEKTHLRLKDIKRIVRNEIDPHF